MFTLSGRTAAVIGATGYQGLGVVRALLDGGMNVAMLTHMPERVAPIIASLPEEQRSRCVGVSNEGGDGPSLSRVVDAFGSLDVLIPNHGPGPRAEGLAELDFEDFTRRLNMMVAGTANIIRYALPYLEKSRAGRIILISSAGARLGLAEEGFADCVVKGAVQSMTSYLARELAPKGITVNCIAKSGLKDTPFLKKPEPGKPPVLGEPTDSPLLDRIPLGISGTPESFGAAAAWLASEEAGFVTGEIVNLSGGLLLG